MQIRCLTNRKLYDTFNTSKLTDKNEETKSSLAPTVSGTIYQKLGLKMYFRGNNA